MKFLILSLLSTISLFGQIQKLPNFAALFGEYGSASSPKWAGAVAMGVPITPTAWSFTIHQYVPSHGQLFDLTTTGVAADAAKKETKYGRLDALLVANIGSSTGNATNLLFTSGGFVTDTFKNGFGIIGGVLENKAANVSSFNILIGSYFTW